MCTTVPLCANTKPPSMGILIRGNWSETSKIFVASDAVNTNIFYVAGTFSGTINVGDLTATSAGMRDGFVVAFERPMKPLWINSYGGGGEDSLTTIVANNSGGYLCALACGGGTGQTVTYTIGGTTFTGRGSYDAVVVSTDEYGVQRWARNDGDLFSEVPSQIFQENSDIYIAGNFYQRSRFGSDFVSDSGAATVYVQKLSSSGNHVWLRQTYGVVLHSGYRGLAVNPSVLGRTERGIMCVAGVAGGVQWGEAVYDSISLTQPYFAAGLVFDGEGANQNIVALAACNADSIVGAATFGNTLVTAAVEHEECDYARESSVVIHIGSQPPITRAFPVGGWGSQVNSLSYFGGTRLCAVGMIEKNVRWESVAGVEDVAALSGSDGFVALFAEDGIPLFTTLVGSTVWSRCTGASTSAEDVVVTTLFQGSIPTAEAGTLHSDSTGVAVLRYVTPVTNIKQDPETPFEDSEGVFTIELYTITGQFVGRFENTLLQFTTVPNGLYIVRTLQSTTLQSIYR
ncbi:MAG: hypothetical protein HQ472_04725 [Ignavibacteria bacterium]|nr:hypothetical protein [Ignavibacteria bacterium]